VYLLVLLFGLVEKEDAIPPNVSGRMSSQTTQQQSTVV
jgi:hypothetical protein